MASPNCSSGKVSPSSAKFKCESLSYSTSESLIKDIPTHKAFCRKLAKFFSTNPRPAEKLIQDVEAKSNGHGDTRNDCPDSTGRRPSLEHSTVSRLGIILSVNSRASQYVWVTCHQTIYGTNIDENIDDFDPFSAGRIEVAQMNSIIEFWFRPGVHDGTKSRLPIMSTLEDFHRRDRSIPVLALRYRYNDGTDESFGGVYQDMTPRDCHTAQTWLAMNSPPISERDSEGCIGEVAASPSQIEVQGVIINCLGFHKLLDKPKYVEIKISKTDKIFKTGNPSSISQHLGIPLLLKKCRSPHSFAENSHLDPYKNLEAHFLLMGADPTNELEWRSVDLGRIGSVLVVRKDGKDVTRQQVEAMVRFCRDKLLGGMVDVDNKGKEARKRFVEEEMCRGRFEEFFEGMKRRRISKGDGSWKDAVSPYAV